MSMAKTCVNMQEEKFSQWFCLHYYIFLLVIYCQETALLCITTCLVFKQCFNTGFGIWVRSWSCGCLVTWFCYQMIARPGNKTAAVLWPDPYILNQHVYYNQHNICIDLKVPPAILWNLEIRQVLFFISDDKLGQKTQVINDVMW